MVRETLWSGFWDLLCMQSCWGHLAILPGSQFNVWPWVSVVRRCLHRAWGCSGEEGGFSFSPRPLKKKGGISKPEASLAPPGTRGGWGTGPTLMLYSKGELPVHPSKQWHGDWWQLALPSSGDPVTLSAAAAKSLQSSPTLCDPIDGSPPGSAVPGILQARTLEWVAISFSITYK